MSNKNNRKLRINSQRLSDRIARLAQIGAIDGNGVCRLALSDEDKQARDLLCEWMLELDLKVSVDQIGNVIGLRAGLENAKPVMTGSHIDTVATGGRFDGNLGVLAGLEVIQTLNDANITTKHPLAVAFFTNEEGARYAPDMMGSGVHQGAMDLHKMLNTKGIDGTSVGTELERIGYAGQASTGDFRAHCYLELHIEQGPVLEQEGIDIGAVTGVQGISWTEYTLGGVSNHAGTTPMSLRQDAAYAAASIIVEARRIALVMGGTQVATVGVNELDPNLINVIAKKALLTVDLRNMEEGLLQVAEKDLSSYIDKIAAEEGIIVTKRRLARFKPVVFDPQLVSQVEQTALALGLSCKRMPSGAGHDAQMFAPNCPAAMIFVPSEKGVSHNVAEYTPPHQLESGANVLLRVLLEQAGT